jgi:hypothetical protein
LRSFWTTTEGTDRTAVAPLFAQLVPMSLVFFVATGRSSLQANPFLRSFGLKRSSEFQPQ